MNRLFLHIIYLLAVITLWSCEHVNKSISEGNQLYFDGRYDDAVKKYDKAIELDSSSFIASFNKGNALYKASKGLDTLKNHFNTLLEQATDDEEIACIYHNLGNAQLVNSKVKEAIESYKSALRLRPNYEDTRYNLAYAQKLIPPEEKDSNQNQDQQDQQNKDNKDNKDNQNKDENEDNKDNKEDQQNKDENKDDQNKDDKKDPNKDGEDDENQKPKDGQQKPQPGKLTEEQAKKLLDHIRREEKGIRAKINKEKEGEAQPNNDKDW